MSNDVQHLVTEIVNAQSPNLPVVELLHQLKRTHTTRHILLIEKNISL
jgi:hypothetical protein